MRQPGGKIKISNSEADSRPDLSRFQFLLCMNLKVECDASAIHSAL